MNRILLIAVIVSIVIITGVIIGFLLTRKTDLEIK